MERVQTFTAGPTFLVAFLALSFSFLADRETWLLAGTFEDESRPRRARPQKEKIMARLPVAPNVLCALAIASLIGGCGPAGGGGGGTAGAGGTSTGSAGNGA